MKPHTKAIERDSASIRCRVTDTLRQSILYGHFEPGQRLIETDLCESLGVSRPLLREALQHLAAEQLITVILHRGPVVASLTLEEACNIYSVRKSIEMLAAEGFARNATKGDMAHLVRAFDDFATLCESAQLRDVIRAKDRISNILVQGCKNPVVGDILHLLKNRTALLRRKTLSQPGRTKALHKEIAAIVRALKARDPELASQRSAIHVENATKAMVAGFGDTHEASLKRERSDSTQKIKKSPGVRLASR